MLQAQMTDAGRCPTAYKWLKNRCGSIYRKKRACLLYSGSFHELNLKSYLKKYISISAPVILFYSSCFQNNTSYVLRQASYFVYLLFFCKPLFCLRRTTAAGAEDPGPRDADRGLHTFSLFIFVLCKRRTSAFTSRRLIE